MIHAKAATMKSSRLPGFANIIPPRPQLRDDRVAAAIAETLVEEVNLDDVYWTESEKADRKWEVQLAIQKSRGKSLRGIAGSLQMKYWGKWPEEVCEHLEHIIDSAAADELERAVERWKDRYEVKEQAK